MASEKHVAEIAQVLSSIHATLGELTGCKKEVNTKVDAVDSKVDTVTQTVFGLHSSVDALRSKIDEVLFHQHQV